MYATVLGAVFGGDELRGAGGGELRGGAGGSLRGGVLGGSSFLLVELATVALEGPRDLEAGRYEHGGGGEHRHDAGEPAGRAGEPLLAVKLPLMVVNHAANEDELAVVKRRLGHRVTGRPAGPWWRSGREGCGR